MSRTVDTLYRQWLMLSKIPRYPRTIGAPELNSLLNGEGYEIDIRTVQRDLNKLSGTFPLSSEIQGRKQSWFWMENAVTQDLPGMEPVTALAFQMAESYLSPLLPQATLELLQPYFNRASEVFRSATSQLKDWSKKVSVIDRGPVLIKPTIDPAIQQVVYQALLQEKKIQATYKPRNPKPCKEYCIHPLGIVSRQGVIYLVCTLWDYQDIKQLALHRFKSAELLDENSVQLEGFSIDSYVNDDQQFSYPISSEPIYLQALFNAKSIEHLYETPLTKDQTLTSQDDGRLLLEGTITDTLELRWWLASFGSGAEVLKPDELRQHFVKEAQLLVGRYQ